jgi:gas vesicle protein
MSKTGSKIIIAAAAGLAAGFALGILFAPERGSKTRRKLKKNMEELVKGNFPDLGEKLEDLKKMFTQETGKKEDSSKEQH